MKNSTVGTAIPVSNYKKTKMLASIGPSTNSYDAIYQLIEAGVNGFGFNMSHGTYDERVQQISWIRKASKNLKKPVAIIAELQGPKIRLGDFDGFVNVQAGMELAFAYESNYQASSIIPTQYDLSKKVSRGERLYLYDGKIHTIVTSVKDGIVYANAQNDGVLVKRKGINLPDTNFGGDVLTKKDRADLAFLSEQDIDYVGLAFVQTAQDVMTYRKLMNSLGMQDKKIMVKVETQAAIDNLESIVIESDVVMVARGDLAIETLPEAVPVLQRKIISLCMKHKKVSLVATQMLASMTDVPEPTRAEASDVATSVLAGADAVMLRDETAAGKYPIEAAKVMKRIIRYTEENAPLKAVYGLPEDQSRPAAISRAIVSLAESTNATAIVAETKSGATARNIAALRPAIPVIAVTSSERVAQQIAIVYSCKTYVRPDDKFAATKLTNWLLGNKVMKKGDIVVTSSGKYPGVVGSTDTIKIRVLE
jgi:pyruvate kinase